MVTEVIVLRIDRHGSPRTAVPEKVVVSGGLEGAGGMTDEWEYGKASSRSHRTGYFEGHDKRR